MNLGDKLRQMPKKRRRIAAFAGAAVLIILLFLGFFWLTEWRFMEETDDAYVQGDIAAISPKLNAYIKTVPVLANQQVKSGDILFLLDDGDYRIALGEAAAKLATQQSTLQRIEKETEATRSMLEESKASYSAALAVQTNAQLTYHRAEALQKQQYVPVQQLDNARSALAQADANVQRAQAQIATANANINVLQAQYAEARSQLAQLQLARDQAARDLSFTIIRAPFDGIVGNLTGKQGDYVTNGQKLAALVPSRKLYIDANFKETQLKHIYGGETAYISVDGYDGGTFKGQVLSLAPATGAVFSILPPQNATGNFTKVVQRIPVRIAIPQEILDTGRIRAGMSVVVEIDTRTKPEDALPIAALPQAQQSARQEATEREKDAAEAAAQSGANAGASPAAPPEADGQEPKEQAN